MQEDIIKNENINNYVFELVLETSGPQELTKNSLDKLKKFDKIDYNEIISEFNGDVNNKKNFISNNRKSNLFFYNNDRSKLSEYNKIRKINNGKFTWTIRRHSNSVGNYISWIIVQQALAFISSISTIDFIYVNPSSFSDLSFIFGGNYHKTSRGGYCSFGREEVLAHAYFPDTFLAGDIHINDNIKYNNYKNSVSYSLFHLCVHEIGHSLGLEHNLRKTSIMYPSMGPNKHLDLDFNIFDSLDKNSLYT